jgi:ABC-type polysaccharide/polyol phosphate transport system ATPase subunit
VTETALVAESVSKRFRIYHERNQTIKQAILRRRRGVYEEFWALKDVSLEIPKASTYGFIGENGSGKSTLLKCMARILVPDGGAVRSHGSISALLELGAGFHPELSGRENVFLNGAILGIPAKELNRKFDEIVEFSGIERFIDTPVKNYSSGMYVRLGFSVAINVSPDILLVDEVLAVGDAEFQMKCRAKFKELKDSGCTIVLVTHAMGMVKDLCDSAAWLEHGKLMTTGSTRDVIRAYMTRVAEHTGEEYEEEDDDEDGAAAPASARAKLPG